MKTVEVTLQVNSATGEARIKSMGNAMEGMGKAGTTAGENTRKGGDAMTGSFIKAGVALEAFKKIADFAWASFQDGLGEMQETEEAMRRIETVSNLTGQGIDALNVAAANIAADGLVQMDEAMQQVASLAQAGFETDQIEALLMTFKDLAATAGGDVSENMDKLVKAFATGRFAGEDLVKMLPSLKSNLEAAGLSLQDLANGSDSAAVKQVILNTAFQDGQNAAGGAEKATNTLAGQMQILDSIGSDLKETFATEIVNGFMASAGGAGSFTDKLKEAQPQIKILGEGLGWLAGKLLELTKMWVDAMGKLYSTIGTVADKVASVFSKSGKGMGDLTERTKFLTQGMNLGGNAMTSAGKAASQFGGDVEKTNVSLEQYVAKVPPTVKGTKETGEAMSKAADAAKKQAEEMKKAEEAIDKWGASIVDMPGQIKNLTSNLELLSSAQTVSNTAMLAWAEAIGATNTPMQNLLADLSLLEPGLDAVGLVTGNFGQSMDTAMIYTASWTDSLDNLLSSLGPVGDAIGGLVGSVISSLGQMESAFTQTFDAILKATNSQAAAVAGGIGSAMNVLGQAVGGEAGGALSTIGSFTATGAMFGPWGAAVGAALGIAVAAFKAFSKDWDAEAKKFSSSLGEISDELAKQIAELAKEIGDSKTANVLSLGAIADEVGINAGNIQAFFSETRDAFVLLDTGFIDAAQASTVLEDMFPRLAEAAEEFGGAYQTQLLDLISLSRQFGLEIQAIDDYIQGQIDTLLTGIASLTDQFAAKMEPLLEQMKNAEPPTGGGSTDLGIGPGAFENMKGKFVELSNFAVAAFNEIILSGGSVRDAMAAIGPTLDVLKDAAEKFGLEGNAAFQELMKNFEALEKFKGPLDRLNALTQVYTSLANIGSLTSNQFDQFGDKTDKIFANMVKGGMDQGMALQAITPQLEELIRMEEQYGYEIDAGTQALIDQAREAGYLAEKEISMNDVLMQGFGSIIEALGGTIPAAWEDMMAAGEEATDSVAEASEEAADAMTAANETAAEESTLAYNTMFEEITATAMSEGILAGDALGTGILGGLDPVLGGIDQLTLTMGGFTDGIWDANDAAFQLGVTIGQIPPPPTIPPPGGGPGGKDGPQLNAYNLNAAGNSEALNISVQLDGRELGRAMARKTKNGEWKIDRNAITDIV